MHSNRYTLKDFHDLSGFNKGAKNVTSFTEFQFEFTILDKCDKICQNVD